MLKIALATAAVAMLSASTIMSNRAEATTLGASAGVRAAVDTVHPVEQVTYRYYRRHHFAYRVYPRVRVYPSFRAYAYYPPRPFYRRYHGYY
jgi:hypothetical protein